MRTIHTLLFACLLAGPFPSLAQDASGDTCCHALAAGLPLDGLAAAVGTAGDKPLWVMPDDGTLLDFELDGICLENLINPLLREGKVRALDCGDSFGLFGAGLAAAEMSCDEVTGPAEQLPPGDLEGWTLAAVFTQRHGERLVVLSGPDKKSHLLGPGMALDGDGTKVEGIGAQGVLLSRSGIDTLDGSAAAVDIARLGDAPPPTCFPIVEEEPEAAEASIVPAGSAQAAVAEAETAAAAAAAEEQGEPEITYTCEGIEADFVQRPLPVAVCDDPLHRGTEATAIVDFGADGWVRKLVALEAADDIKEALGAAIADWRVVPVETTEGTLGRVRLTVVFPLEIPCR